MISYIFIKLIKHFLLKQVMLEEKGTFKWQKRHIKCVVIPIENFLNRRWKAMLALHFNIKSHWLQMPIWQKTLSANKENCLGSFVGKRQIQKKYFNRQLFFRLPPVWEQNMVQWQEPDRGASLLYITLIVCIGYN